MIHDPSCFMVQYSATSALYGGTLLPYFLDETSEWGLDVNNLRGQIQHVSDDIAHKLAWHSFATVRSGAAAGFEV